jgi:hypothetical protein
VLLVFGLSSLCVVMFCLIIFVLSVSVLFQEFCALTKLLERNSAGQDSEPPSATRFTTNCFKLKLLDSL